MPTLPSKVFTSFEEFLKVPDGNDAGRPELRDGQVVHLTAEWQWHASMRHQIRKILTPMAEESKMIAIDWLPYRPAPDLQSWYATGCGVVEKTHWNAMLASGESHPVFTPLMILEVQSDWNRQDRIVQQRRVALTAGTKEFWIIKPEEECVSVTRGHEETLYFSGEAIPTPLFPNRYVHVDGLWTPSYGR
jgi:Uma2 family endonuclease